MKRIRFGQNRSPGERLIKEARLAREKAEQLPDGQERAGLLKKARRAETEAQINKWLNSAGLRRPE